MRTAELHMPSILTGIQPLKPSNLIILAKQEAKRSAFLTPWGLAEMKRLAVGVWFADWRTVIMSRTDDLGNLIFKAKCRPCSAEHDADTCPVCNAASLFEKLCRQLERELDEARAGNSGATHNPLSTPLLHPLDACLRALKFGRPKVAQDLLEKAAIRAEHLGLSYQQVWYHKQKKAGRCPRCGGERAGGALCAKCQDKAEARALRRQLATMQEGN